MKVAHVLLPAQHWWQRHILLHLEAPTAEDIITLHMLATAEANLHDVSLTWEACDAVVPPSKWTLLSPKVVVMRYPGDTPGSPSEH